MTQGFFIGKKGTLYYRREDGSLARFGIRVKPDNTIRVFDHLFREWVDLPDEIERNGGDPVELTAEEL